MRIEGEKVYLLPITKKDTANVVKWRNRVREHFIYQELFTAESHNEWLEKMVFTGKVKQFVIYGKEDSMPVGSIFLRDIDTAHGKAEYGLFIGEDVARGKGYGTDAARLICEYGFKELHLHKIFMRVFADNEASIRSNEKAGFVREGYLKEDVKINWQYRDVILMAKWAI